MWPKSSKRLVKDKTPVKLQAWHFTFKTRSSDWRCSLKKDVLKKFVKNSQENTCVEVSFFIKLQAKSLQLYLKMDSNTGVFLLILQSFKNTFFREHVRATASANPLCTADPEINACFLIHILLLWCLICVYV